ncbi:cytochrome b5 domain-containing protein [Azospirillum sp. ST 5-10]|uniref:cytochrome b5 domain-containing protein n=1 Tax=unclassified Azospirillum TaxID=2630922 RepID=UPI003F4A290C
MMRTLYVAATAAFWAAVAAFWAGAVWAPQAGQPAGGAADRVISATELARHARPDDCWMAIRGGVYDLTAYLPDHPSRPQIIEVWCGREATDAYDTKTRGRPHSGEADDLLTRYRIGTFAPEAR